MKKLFLTILLMPVMSFSQEKEVLKYFISKDSLVGVKNQKGEIIIPAQFINLTGMKDNEIVESTNNTIFLILLWLIKVKLRKFLGSCL
ncbi:hypothetical protein OWR28_16350 [Chryseobacterium sp. 1B4]